MHPLILSNTALFRGAAPEETEAMLRCLGSERRVYPKGARILRAGGADGKARHRPLGPRVDPKRRPVGQYHRAGQRAPGADLRRDLRLHRRGAAGGRRGGGGHDRAVSGRQPGAAALSRRLRPSPPARRQSPAPVRPEKPEPVAQDPPHLRQIHPRGGCCPIFPTFPCAAAAALSPSPSTASSWRITSMWTAAPCPTN